MPAGFQYVACSLKIGGVEGGFCSWDGVNTVVGDIGKFAADRAVVELAAAGDAVAPRLIERLAEEIVLMATRALADLGLAERQATLLLGGGTLRDGQGFLYEQTLSRLADRAPHAVPVPVTAAPVLGAALDALDAAGAPPAAAARLRAGCRLARRDREESRHASIGMERNVADVRVAARW